MDAEKSYKLSDVSAELHRTHKDILEFLQKANFNVPKKPPQAMLTWKMPEEFYLACLQEFDRSRWLRMQEEIHRMEENRKHLEVEQKRREEMELREKTLKQSIHEDLSPLESIESQLEPDTSVQSTIPVVESPVLEPVEVPEEMTPPKSELPISDVAPVEVTPVPQVSIEEHPAEAVVSVETVKPVESEISPVQVSVDTEIPAEVIPVKVRVETPVAEAPKAAAPAAQKERPRGDRPRDDRPRDDRPREGGRPRDNARPTEQREPVKAVEPEQNREPREKVKEHIPLPEYKGLKIVSFGEKKRQRKPEAPPTSLVKGKVNKEKERERERERDKDKPKQTPSAIPANHKGPKIAEPAANKETTTTADKEKKTDEGEKKWKRLSKLTKAEADEIVRVKSKALKERVVPAALPEMAKGRRPKPKRVDVQAVESQLRQTLAAISEGRRVKKRRKRIVRDDGVEIETNVLRITEFVTTAELANLLEIEPSELIKKCIGMGMLVTLNQRLDKDTLVLLAAEYGTEVEFVSDDDDEEEEVEDVEGELLPRQPVVTVMGHVDHGKTTLLDYLRKTNVAGGEHGGITQHIGAYEVNIRDQRITFLDTPGHEAFTAMRARGAQITDIVVLVVAADDQVMPQTLEAIDHARAANVPIVIAINKIDKPNAAPETIKRQLADRGILIEEWGGKHQSAEISAKKGLFIEKLLDEILIAAEIAEIKAVFEGPARGVVLESRLDKGRGTMATVLIQRGTLRVGDAFVAGQHFGKIRMLLNEVGDRRDECFPGQPVQVVGFTGIPQAGDRFLVYGTEREAKEVANRRTQQQREQQYKQVRLMTLEQFSKQQAAGSGFKELNIVIKGDADGSVEVLADSLMKLSGTELKVNVIHKSVGAITESDVLLAAASRAIVIGFHVHPNPNARELAAREKIDIRLYKVIYNVVDDVRAALEGMLRPDYKEVVRATVLVRETFKISRVGTIAGCFVQNGTITRSSKVRLLRDGVEVWAGSLNSLQRFKDSVREVKEGFECGIVLDGFHDIKVGDLIEAFDTVAEARKLSEQLVM